MLSATVAPSAWATATRLSCPWSARHIIAPTSARYSQAPAFQPTMMRSVLRGSAGISQATATPATTAASSCGCARRWRARRFMRGWAGRDNSSMHPNALLELCTDLVRQVLKLDAPADGVVSAFFRTHRNLGPRERHTLAETIYAVLRRRLLYQHLAQGSSGAGRAPPGHPGLAGGRWLPARCTRSARASMAGALPRRRPGDAARQAAPQPAGLAGRRVARAAARRPISGRWPRRCCSRRRWTCASTPSRPSARRCSASWPRPASRPCPRRTRPGGCAWPGKPALQKLGVFTRGEVEVQDEGSQLLALLTDAKRGEMVVDFCAGAGGKTLALGAAMRNTGRLYAYDTSGHRLDAMKPRLARSGLSNVHPVQLAHERDERIKRMAGKIDRVLIDAPCSGLGTLRRNPDLKWRQSPKAVAGTAGQAARHPGQRRAAAQARRAAGLCHLQPAAQRERGRGRCLRTAAGRALRAAGRRANCWPRPRWLALPTWTRPAGCGCGRSATAPTASSPRCGSDVEPRSGLLICRNAAAEPANGQPTLSNSRH